jgi:dihydrofolate synthase / folylpolyglutamate synthase
VKVIPIKTKVFREGENLANFVVSYIKKLKENTIIVVTSKIVALSEKRTATIQNERTKEKLIIAESELAIPTKYVWLTLKDNMVMASAGIDESNANGKLILLPKDSFKTARLLRKQLQRKYKLKKIAVIITDSRTAPLRSGVTGVALGYSGVRGLRDYRGTPDIFERKFEFSQTNVVDSLATSAVLVMGEGNEQQPLALIEKAPVVFCERVRKNELRIDPRNDLYKPFFSALHKH